MVKEVSHQVGRIVEIWRYPVKSLLGESLAAAEVGALGVTGDRQLGLRDQSDGTILSAKRDGTLFALQAITAEDGAVTIELPGGTTLAAADPAADDVLSTLLGRRVSLAKAAPGREERIGMGTTSDLDEGRGSFHAGVAGGFFDSTPLHLLTTASLAAAAGLYPGGTWDHRRFRPNLLIETDDAPGFVEESWVGAEVSLGAGLRLRIVKPCGRCVMTTHAQEDLDKDRGILRTLARKNDNHIGVLAEVVTAGEVAVGDPVRLQSEPR